MYVITFYPEHAPAPQARWLRALRSVLKLLGEKGTLTEAQAILAQTGHVELGRTNDDHDRAAIREAFNAARQAGEQCPYSVNETDEEVTPAPIDEEEPEDDERDLAVRISHIALVACSGDINKSRGLLMAYHRLLSDHTAIFDTADDLLIETFGSQEG